VETLVGVMQVQVAEQILMVAPLPQIVAVVVAVVGTTTVEHTTMEEMVVVELGQLNTTVPNEHRVAL
jgi:hypothetical protein